MATELTRDETLRYNRQIVLPNFGFEGQEKLKAAHVAIIGLGGLGCASAAYLAASGIGQLTLVDFDTISLSNLQRQILYHDANIGELKVIAAQRALSAINPYSHIDIISETLDDNKLHALIAQCHVVVDCTDNVATREQLNRLCHAQAKPLVSGAAIRMEGQITLFTYQAGEPCYRCLSQLFGKDTLSCVESGIIAPLVGTIGSLQALETIKLISNYGHPQSGKLLIIDALTLQFHTIALPRNPQCEICSA